MSSRFVVSLALLLMVLISPFAAAQDNCTNTITAKVVALDQPFFLNRLGAMMPEGMVYALERDVDRVTTCPQGQWCPRARLKPEKRPRPIVLRVNVGDCLSIYFTNLLADSVAPFHGIQGVQPATRWAGIHVAGMQMVKTIDDDSSNVGVNANSLAAPGQSKTYLLRAIAEGTFLINSEGAAWGGLDQPNDGAQVTAGLFGAVNVEPARSVWLRSQITHDEMLKAVDVSKGNNGFSPTGQPFLDFKSPVLQILGPNNEIVSSDLTAVIAGPAPDYLFPDSGDPNTSEVPYEPRRREPFREFTIEYHELNDSQQAFPIFDYQAASLTATLQSAGDAFAINYGSGGIGAEILANRFGLGPMNSCADCRFEEFFLSSWTVGDPAMVVDYPANSPCSDTKLNSPYVTNTAMATTPCTPGVQGNAPKGMDGKKIVPQRKATKALYPSDPSNVYHSYINDRVIFRTLHAGTGVSHVHHLHAHQWFHSPNSEGSTYLDSQLINPGSAYTMEIAHLGSGNLNKVVGDAIFHCHFYPHFAAGMWAHWRSHDVFEEGTKLDAYGKPLSGWNRAQPDGEIAAGTPIPALVPMPGKPMAPTPARVQIVKVDDPNDSSGPPVGYRAETNSADLAKGLNPGFPFFIPGVGGTRAPHPPLDFAVDKVKMPKTGIVLTKELDGGLPRHLLLNGNVHEEAHNYLNFEKDIDYVNAYRLPEKGTDVEQVAMAYHAQCTHPTFNSLGPPAKFRTNGLPPVHGAPYADPGVSTESDSESCGSIKNWIEYRAAVMQTDFVINKVGWHYPQSRLLTLWQDVQPTLSGERPPEPFFIRASSHTGVNYWHTNLVPAYYELDDYQVRTPTDIIGQHIHLVKFDVTSSDGAANGFNYEDGTLSYQEVQELIKGINQCGGLALAANTISKCGTKPLLRKHLTAEAPPSLICPDPNTKQCQEWHGAQTTVQRWYADPLTDASDVVNGERTLRTVFTHDHFGPSTHQQVGLYAALLVEPTDSEWFVNNPAKTKMRTRKDGGPTSWEAIIETPKTQKYWDKDIYREFALALQDFQFAYLPSSISEPHTVKGNETFFIDGTKKTSIPVTVKNSWADPSSAVEPANIQNLSGTPTANPPTPGPQLISAGPSPGTLSFNYRNEPLPFRLAMPGSFSGGDVNATDLSYVFSSDLTRNLPQMNSQPPLGAPIGTSGFRFPKNPLSPGMEPGDPFTPLLRAYEGDRVQVRVIVGAHMLPHDFSIQGIKWLFEPSFADSGFRSNQSMGISEHWNFIFETPRASPVTPPKDGSFFSNWSDYLYVTDAANQKHGIVDGMWGIFRAYKSKRDDLAVLSTNAYPQPVPQKQYGYSCPPNAPMRRFTVNAESPSTPIIFNSRGVDGANKFPSTTIQNPYPLLYTFQNTTPPGGAQTNVIPNSSEPLILRANAGECIALTLKNAMNASANVFNVSSTAAFAADVQLFPSTYAGLTPALLSFDVMNSGGLNVGFNPVQTVNPGASRTYYWYAGQTKVDAQGNITGTPIELGGVNLTPSDPLEQDKHGLVGGLVVEPPATVACVDDNFIYAQGGQKLVKTYASATVYDGTDCNYPGKLRHREFVVVTQDDLTNLTWGSACYCLPGMTPGANCTGTGCEQGIGSPPSPTIQVGVNYRVEPMAYRFNATEFNDLQPPPPQPQWGLVWRGFADDFVIAEPQTPIFAAARNTPTRLHLLHPGGSGDQQVLALHGHVWQELPFTAGSTVIGNNTLSMWLGARDNYGANTSYPINLPAETGGAGGRNGVMGDYIYRTTPANFVTQGIWGLMRVGAGGSDIVSGLAQFSPGGLQVAGSSSVFVDDKTNAKNGQRAKNVALSVRTKGTSGDGTPLATVEVGDGGLWSYNSGPTSLPNAGNSEVVAVSPLGGRAILPVTLSLLPSSPAAAQRPDVQGESIRFVNTPRPTSADPKPAPTAKPQEGLLGPPNPNPAPKSGEPQPPAPPPPPQPKP